MQVVCTPKPVVYIEGAPDSPHEALNLVWGTDIVDREMRGYDAAPVIVDAGCGITFEIPDDRVGWDVNPAQTDAGLVVVERHKAVRCPSCGRTADHLSEAVANVPMADYVRGVRDDFLARVVGDDLLSQTPEEMRDLIWRGVPSTGGVYLKGVDEHGIPRLGALPSGGADAGYSHVTEGAVALSAATAKTIIGAKAGSAVGLSWTGFWIGFDGVTASAIPVLFELMKLTFATNSPGTASTGTTEQQPYGLVNAADWTGGRNWTTEPTAVAVIGEGLLTPNGGVILYDDPLGKEPDNVLATGFGIRCNAPATVNVRATQKLRHS